MLYEKCLLVLCSLDQCVIQVFKSKKYHPRLDMAQGRLRTPAPTIAVTLWKVEYHHFAFLDDVIGSQSSIAFCSAVLLSLCHQYSKMLSRGFLFKSTDCHKSVSLYLDSQNQLQETVIQVGGHESKHKRVGVH